MKTIPDFENYSISETGEVWSHKRTVNGRVCGNKFLTQRLQNRGYLSVCLAGDKRKTKYGKVVVMKTFCVHRLVAMAYIRMPKKGEEVNHKDGNKFNNHVSNLEWMTHKENTVDFINKVGKKLTRQLAKEIRNRDWKRGDAKRLARRYNVTIYTIYAAKYGISWKN